MKKVVSSLLFLALTSVSLVAQIPDGYYNDAAGKTGDDLKIALHDIIKGHTTISYQQIWNAFWSTDNKGNNVVWDMYSDGANYSYSYYDDDQCGNYEQEGDCFNREHSWPQSWFNNASTPTTDLHHIFPTDGFVNAQRSNFPFGEVNNATWTSQNGSKLGSCKSSLGYTGTVFEPIDQYKGDFARALMYMSVRYYDEDDDWGSSGMTTKSVIKDWAINMLLDWSDNDPVSQKEIDRNNVIYGIQSNRNPFVDHPEYAHIIWEPGWTGVTYNITCASVQHGSISAPATAVEGTMVTLTATPAQGYMLGSWNVYKTGDTSTTVPVSGNTFTMPSFNVTVSATFIQNTTAYNIACATSLAHGSISASVSSAQSGTTITLSNTPASGYVLYSYYVYKTGDVNTIVYSGAGSTFVMPAYNVTVSASFVQPSSYSYVKVTEAPSDWSGEYILVYENSSTEGYVWTGVDAANCYVSKTISDNTIVDGGSVSLTIAPMTGGYSIKVNGGTNNGKYISGSSGSNALNFGTLAKLNTVELESNGVKITSNTSVMRYNSNSNDNRFRYYKSSTYTDQQPIQLYKKIGNVSAPTHTVQFNPNGGSQSSYNQIVNEFEPTALQANTFTRLGYAFDSWNTAANGTGTTYFDGAVVTLLNDLTLYAQWVPKYTITCASVEHGIITASPVEAVEGDIITLTATPATGYDLDYWTVTAANNIPVEVDGNRFVMPASSVTVSATFVYVGQSYTQKYYLVTSNDQLVEGRTYLIINVDEKKAMGAQQDESTGNNRVAVSATTSNGVLASLGNACELTLVASGDYWAFYDPEYSDNTGGYLYASSSDANQLRTESTLDNNGKWSVAIAADGKATVVAKGTNTRNTMRFNKSGNCFTCFVNSSSGKDIFLLVRSEEYDYTENMTLPCVNTFDKTTIRSGVTLTATTILGATMCNNASQFVLEDGAQLFHTTTSAGLNATMKKSITAYSGDGGWYTISAPFATLTPTFANGLLNGSYDLYYYNESGNNQNKEWINYKAESFVLTANKGYLYANGVTSTLRLGGTLNSGTYSETIDLSYDNSNATIKGFNLLGNPTAHDITFTKTNNVSDGYYYLVNGEDWTYTTSNTVPVGRGFMVKANAASQSVTLNPQSKGDNAQKGQYLCLSVGEEKAYVKLDEGVSMPLLSMRGAHTSLYLTREGRPYVMLTRDGTKSLDLCYEAQGKGVQTLTVDAQGLDLNYLHLVDNLTGADIDLLNTPSYTFETKEDDYATRFMLAFAPTDGPSTGSEAFAYWADGEIRLIIETQDFASLQVIDMMGRIIRCGDGVHTVSTSGMTPGVYVLRLVTDDNVRVQKIVVK
ncbi:MAG: endonuclease [Bacteroidales bacterium]|nr:endonuclease [Bacteroidales bacterium]